MFFLTALMQMLFIALELPVDVVGHTMLKQIQASVGTPVFLLFCLSAIVVAPIFEEIEFRGFLQTGLFQVVGRQHGYIAIAATSLIFTLFHITAVTPTALLSLFLLSCCLGFIYERTQSLWTSIICHMLFNTINVAMLLAMPVGELTADM